jgi:hypothetical protein
MTTYTGDIFRLHYLFSPRNAGGDLHAALSHDDLHWWWWRAADPSWSVSLKFPSLICFVSPSNDAGHHATKLTQAEEGPTWSRPCNFFKRCAGETRAAFRRPSLPPVAVKDVTPSFYYQGIIPYHRKIINK